MDAVGRTDLEAMERLLDPAVTWHNTRAFPGPSVLHGPREIFDFYSGLLEEFDAGEFSFDRVEETDGAVVIEIHSRSHGRSSHVPIDVRWAMVVQVRGERVVRIDVFGSFERALEAAG
jgi:ketosteroid isomerase-like protein